MLLLAICHLLNIFLFVFRCYFGVDCIYIYDVEINFLNLLKSESSWYVHELIYSQSRHFQKYILHGKYWWQAGNSVIKQNQSEVEPFKFQIIVKALQTR